MEMCYDGTLVMPTKYILINNEEMLYLDGGVKPKAHWWGISIKLSGKETAQFLGDAGWAASALTSLVGLAGGVASIAVGTILGTYGFVISRMNSNNSGVTFKFTWAQIVSGIPSIVDNY